MATKWEVKGFVATGDSLTAGNLIIELGDKADKNDVLEELNRRYGFRRYDKRPVFEATSIKKLKEVV
jgi:hypothetical protein